MPKPERGFSHFMSNDLQNNKNSALKMIAGFMGALAVLIIAMDSTSNSIPFP
jgi:hypothetical protein